MSWGPGVMMNICDMIPMWRCVAQETHCCDTMWKAGGRRRRGPPAKNGFLMPKHAPTHAYAATVNRVTHDRRDVGKCRGCEGKGEGEDRRERHFQNKFEHSRCNPATHDTHIQTHTEAHREMHAHTHL